MIPENEQKNEKQNEGKEFTTVKPEQSTTTINTKELKSEQEVKLTSSSNDFLTNLIAKNTNRLPEEPKLNGTTSTTPASTVGQKVNEELKDVLDAGEVKFLSSMLVGLMNKLVATALMFYSKDTKDSDYKIEKESADRLTIILGKILEKNKVHMKLEFLFLIAISVAYAQPVKNAMKNRKNIGEALAKARADKATNPPNPPGRPKRETPITLKVVERNPMLDNLDKGEEQPITYKEPEEVVPQYTEPVARNIAEKIANGRSTFTKMELQFQKTFSAEVEKYIFEIKEKQEAERKAKMTFEELEELSKNQQIVVDTTEEDEIVRTTKKIKNPLIKRRVGGQRKG